jgi:trans-aconitate 2-methyltransferase
MSRFHPQWKGQVLSMHQGRAAGTTWNPGQYAKFGDHRLRPALELLARVPLDDPRLVYDLGCGTGEVTALMAERWPEATVIGLDNSPQMLERARSVSGRVAWVEADIATWEPESAPDLIYSNATLQWLGDHDDLFPRLAGMLRSGGCLAVQMPLSWPMPSHRLMRETLANGGPGGTPIGPDALRETVGRNWVADAAHYYDLLVGIASNIDIWETEYLQVLSGDDPVLEWVTGTGLRPILNVLGETDRAVFLEGYRARLRAAYPMRTDGHTLYPFRRLFIVATV